MMVLEKTLSRLNMKVDDTIDRIMSLGRGTLLAKFDVESA